MSIHHPKPHLFMLPLGMALGQQQMEKGDQMLALAEGVAKAGEASTLGLKERLALLNALSSSITTNRRTMRLIPEDLDLGEGSADALLLHVNAVELLLAAGREEVGSNDEDAWGTVVSLWIERVGLPILTSRRLDLGPAQNEIGMRIGRLLASTSSEAIQQAMQAATLHVLDDMSVRVSCPRADKDGGELLEVISAQAGWVASFLNQGAQDVDTFPLAVLERTLVNLERCPAPALRSIIVRVVSPALASMLQGKENNAAAHVINSKVWGFVRRLDVEGGLEEQRDALAMLCVLQEVLVPALGLNRSDPTFWTMLRRGLASDCNAVRKRALYVLSAQVEMAKTVGAVSTGAGATAHFPASASSPLKVKFLTWWRRFVQVMDTFNTALETHLLNQALPVCTSLLREAFAFTGNEEEEGQDGMLNGNAASLLPLPSFGWAEALLGRAISVTNFSVQRTYLLWLMSEEGVACVPLSKLGPRFIITKILPAFKEMSNLKDDRPKLGRFLARAIVAQEEDNGARREVLVAVFEYCKDVVRGAVVRQTLLGFIEFRDVFQQTSPCLQIDDVELARLLVCVMNSQYNQGLSQILAGRMVDCLEVFADCQSLIAAGPHGAAVVRTFLLDLPQKVALDSHYNRLVEWLGVSTVAGGATGWWGESTTSAIEALINGSGGHGSGELTMAASGGSVWSSMEGGQCLENVNQSSMACCALACMYLPDLELAHALASALRVLGRIHSHPYLTLRSCLASLCLLRSLGSLLRRKHRPCLYEILRQHTGEVAEFLAAKLQESCLCTRADLYDSGNSGVFGLCVQAFGTVIWLAADVGQVAGAIQRVLKTCSSVLNAGVDDAAAGDAGEIRQLGRAVAVLRSVLEALLLQSSTRLFGEVKLDWAARLMSSLVKAAASLGLRRGKRDFFLSVALENVWRCLVLLYKIQRQGGLVKPTDNPLPVDMAFLFSALEMSSRKSVPDILCCISCQLPFHLGISDSNGTEQERQTRLDNVVTLVLGCIEECNYRQSVMQLAIEMVLSPAILADPTLCRGTDTPVRRFFHRLVDLGTVKRAYILLNATARLTSIWRTEPAAAALAGEFVEEIAQLLVLRELEEDVYQQVNEDERDSERDSETDVIREEIREPQEEHSVAVLRILVLGCLCDLFRPPDDGGKAKQGEFLTPLLTRLFEIAAAVDLRRAQILTSPDYSCKLRAWQAICVLVPFVRAEDASLVQDSVYAAMRVVAVPSIRFYQDTVLALVCQKFPDVAIPFLVTALTDLQVPPLTSGSFISAAGLACLTKNTAFPGGELPQDYVAPLLQAILPWISGQHAITRIVAQLLSFYLLSRLPTGDLDAVKAVESGQSGKGGVSNSRISAGSIDATFLSQTLNFLKNHREIASLRRKAMLRFQETSVPACCTVSHLLAQHSNEQGGVRDLVPEHVEEVLREAMTSLYRDLEAEHHMTYTSIAPVVRGENLFELKQDASSARALLLEGNAEAEAADCYSLQKKIVVSDVLTSLLPAPPTDKSQNTRGVLLQELVVCASLLERVPNVAGLARTCEIFAASKLIIPDLRMLKDPLFDQISSSAWKWIQMEEIHEGHTRAFLRRYKQEGYTVVGLEQTDDSSCLSRVALPRKMLLLLGREKEGIPVPLLQELDLVVQIPQLGLVRSLNVHVSASLIVWEYFKQHRKSCGKDQQW